VLVPGAINTTAYTATYTIAAADVPGEVRNTATATGTPQATTSVPNPEPVVSTPSSTVTPTTAPATALKLVKRASARLARRGDIVRYTIEVTNNDTANAAVVDVVDTLPVGFAYVPGLSQIDGEDVAEI